ncbi:MAG TPA: tetratricopeptide repeat protein [Gammaproteobacteria bacterium]|nr:tetratricopeptide repeat protein [Gammaproteobacteria bacterium]
MQIATEKTLSTPEEIKIEQHPSSIPPSIQMKYPGSMRNRDAIITQHGVVLKRPTKMLNKMLVFYPNPESYVPIEIEASRIAAYKEALMLSLGRCFFGDAFPEPDFEVFDKELWLKIPFIEGSSLGLQYFDRNPEQFISDLAKLTTIMVLFKNSDMFNDNLIVGPDGSIHGIDLAECGGGAPKDFYYTQWRFRKFQTPLTFIVIDFPDDLLNKLQEHTDLYCLEVRKAINSIREIIKKGADRACIKAFHSMRKDYLPHIDNVEKFIDMSWYYQSCVDFLELTRDSCLLLRKCKFQDIPEKYSFFYTKEFEENFKNSVISTFKLRDIRDKNIFDLLSSSPGEDNNVLIGIFCNKISIMQRIYFVRQILPFCIDYNNLPMLEALLEANKDITDNFENFEYLLSKNQREMLKKLFDMREIKASGRMLLNEFIKYGNITDAGIKLTMAQLASRKDHFNPTVISDKENFSNYLKALKLGMRNTERPIREVFIMGDPHFNSGTHWVSGIIEIDAKNNVKLLLIDSVGDELSSCCVASFAKQFPQGMLYRNIEKRQYQPKGCSIYAMDDARHAFTVEKYLKQNIFDYLDKQNYPIKRFKLEGFIIRQRPCHLPLSFYRTAQSLAKAVPFRFFDESSSVINKKAMDLGDCRKKDMKEIDGKLRNRRIPYVSNKFLKKNMEFLDRFGDEKVASKMQNFSLSAFQQRMRQRYAASAFRLGISYAKGIGVDKDEKKAFSYLSRKEEISEEESLCSYAYCWQHGIGVDKDEKEAFRLYKLSAEAGSLEGQVRLGECYQFGIGVEKDEKEAVKLYQLAAEKEDAYAQYRLGYCYHYGIGVTYDVTEAVKWYQLSADQGDANGLYGLAYCYQHGIEVTKDVRKAFELYQLSAAEGDLNAKAELTYFYQRGISPEKSQIKVF